MLSRVEKKFASTIRSEDVLYEKLERNLIMRRELIRNLIDNRADNYESEGELEEGECSDKEECEKKLKESKKEEEKESTALEPIFIAFIPRISVKNEESDLKKLAKDENYMDFMADSQVKGVLDKITNYTCLGVKEIKRVYYTNSIQGGHARVVIEILNNIHISFSYGQIGGRDCFLTEGVLTIEIFNKFPDAVPGIRECSHLDLKDEIKVKKAIGIAKLIFQNENFIEFNYWHRNCYVFADKLFSLLTGDDNFGKLKWFISEVARGNKWVSDPSRLDNVYGKCPYK